MIDALLRFSNAQAVTATAASTNLIDLGAAKDLGVGNVLYLVVVCVTTMTDSGSDSTLAVTVETDDDVTFGSATASAQTIGTFAAVAAAGTRFVVPLASLAVKERYMRLKYTTSGGDLSAGAFTAYLTDNVTQWLAYADGITITS